MIRSDMGASNMQENERVNAGVWKTYLWSVRAVAFAAVVFLLGTVWQERSLPFDRSMGAGISSRYFGMACRGYEEFGLARIKAAPLLFFQEGTTETTIKYLNHPVLPYLYTYSFYRVAPGITSLNLSAFVLLVICVLGMLYLGRVTKAPLGIAYTLAIFPVLPYVLQQGRMIDAIVHSTAFLPWGLAVWWKLREKQDQRRWMIYFSVALLGGLIDWFPYFLVPMIWLDIFLLRSRIAKPWRTAFWVGFPYGVGLISFFVWIYYHADSGDSLKEQLDWLMGVLVNTGGREASIDFATFWDRLYKWFDEGARPAALVLGLIGLGLALVPKFKQHEFSRAALLLFGAGFLPCLVFFARAATHDFWILTALPGLAALAALPLEYTGRFLSRLRAAPVWLGILVLATGYLAFDLGRDSKELHTHYSGSDSEATAAWIDELVPPGGLMLMNIDSHALRFYAETPIYPAVADYEHFMTAVDYLLPGVDQESEIWLGAPRYQASQRKLVRMLPLDRDQLKVRQTVYGPFLVCRLNKKRLLADLERWRKQR